MDITLPARDQPSPLRACPVRTTQGPMPVPVDQSAWQLERSERRLGMCSLDPIEIDYHFARARRFRELAEQAARQLRNSSATGTKGSCPERRR